MKYLASFFTILFLSLSTSCAYTVPNVPVEVRVVDQDGAPVPSAEVKVLFVNLGVDDGRSDGVTNSEGIFSTAGRCNSRIRVYVSKKGYYESSLPEKSIYDPRYPNDPQVIKQDVSLTLREIKNPIPMYAKQLSMTIPEKGQEVGFDLEAGDWVSPYGKGKNADILVLADGYFNSSQDTKSYLRLSFSNPDDGFILLENGIKESALKSPYLAPLSGYKPKITGIQGTFTNNDGKIVQVDELLGSPVIIFRLRTEVDADGNVIKAQYGKIYNGFTFGGAASPDGYFLKYSYYLNPTVNDRNLEYASGETLVEGLKRSEVPSQP